ncbi:unnamed protein product [Prorocentrum cordatum]|uniref:Uncharacterized protein n=1 Tax=Prorocentrum cordatum TaxID=2364126 RepID=A0ABN9RU38_9DINO|nr:unnamed protein product [Polarella glacialis]
MLQLPTAPIGLGWMGWAIGGPRRGSTGEGPVPAHPPRPRPARPQGAPSWAAREGGAGVVRALRFKLTELELRCSSQSVRSELFPLPTGVGANLARRRRTTPGAGAPSARGDFPRRGLGSGLSAGLAPPVTSTSAPSAY